MKDSTYFDPLPQAVVQTIVHFIRRRQVVANWKIENLEGIFFDGFP